MIFGLLQGDASHPTVESLYDRARAEMPTISLKTVYQTVHDLEALGEVHVLDLGTGSVRVDPNVEDAHHHLVCTECGRVRDVLVDVRRPARAGRVPPRASPSTTSRSSSAVVATTARPDVATVDADPDNHRHRPAQGAHAMPELERNARPHDNLKEAFAGESQANRRYLYFAQKADVEGYPDVAALFRSVAEGETGHAFGHFDFLAEVGDPVTGVPVGATTDNLKSAIAGETYEYTEMYPGFAKTARDEGFDEVAEWLETLARAEKSHAGRFSRASSRSPDRERH